MPPFTFIARRKGNLWYIGGSNAEREEKKKVRTFNFLPEGVKYKLTLIAEGKRDKEFSTQYMVVNKSSTVEVRLLRWGATCLNETDSIIKLL